MVTAPTGRFLHSTVMITLLRRCCGVSNWDLSAKKCREVDSRLGSGDTGIWSCLSRETALKTGGLDRRGRADDLYNAGQIDAVQNDKRVSMKPFEMKNLCTISYLEGRFVLVGQ